jgi:hypothetical protein
VVLDCAGVELLDSRALGPILRLNRVLGRRGAALTVCGLNAPLREVFRITRLDRFLVVGDSVAGALAAFPDRPVAESSRPLPCCACCAWPCEAECRVCGARFCDEHGYVAARTCRRHRWVAWVGLAVAGLALVAGVVILRVWAYR